MTTKKRVAIIGGGMGGLAAAFELELRARGQYEITIYERGWRLGGKGASGRNTDPVLGNRIEEHGLHVLMGFYENVFEILCRCYTDLRAAKALPPANGVWWNGVLLGLDQIGFAEPPLGGDPDGSWLFWRVPFQTTTDAIGGPAEALPSVGDLALAALERFGKMLAGHTRVSSVTTQLFDKLGIHTSQELATYSSTDAQKQVFRDVVAEILKRAFDQIDPRKETDHKWFVALYFAGVNLIALVADVLGDQTNFRDRLDQLDYKAWIARYNVLDLPASYLSESAPVNAVYDLVFSRGTGFAAGSALYDTMLMLFHYKGHIFYKMDGGMGDVVFAPLYLWLRARGVRFQFFHDLIDLTLDTTQTRVESLTFDVSNSASAAPYDPLVWIACRDDAGQAVKLPCWPSEPTSSAVIAEPTPTEVKDFELVVLAIPVGAIAETVKGRPRCKNLFVDQDFQRMAEKMVTRGTRAVQLWFDTNLAGLGWPLPGDPAPSSPALGPVVGSYRPSDHFNSWADMSQVLPRETWSGTPPRNIAYLCDVLDGTFASPDAAAKQVHDDALVWLKQAAGGLWPAAANGFPWDKLVDPNGGVGDARFESQYWRANIDGSERYVTGAPKTTALRVDPRSARFSNLYFAGDWVKTPLNAGCVEGAAMGGRTAAQRIIESRPAPAIGRASASTQASYVTRDGDLPLLQPVVMENVTMHAYVLRSDKSTLATVLGQTFGPLGVTCTPLLPYVIVSSVQAPQIRSAVVPDAGYMTEAELGLWIPVRMAWSGGSSIGMYLPYLFVDNPAALLAGREIYGFNKILGLFSYSGNPIDPSDVKAQVLHALSAESKLSWQTVASITGSVTPRAAAWSTLDAAVAEVVAKLVVGSAGKSIDLPQLPLFFLKQVRDARDGALTCEQSLIRAGAAFENVSGGWLDCSGTRLEFPGHATLDIASTLGVPASSTPLLGFWATFTLTIEAGAALAGTSRVG